MSNLEEHYSLTRVVGSGASSKVYFAEDLQTGGPVAVKVVKPDPAIGPSPLAREATILRRACHPNILQFLGIFRITDVDSSMKGCWAIVTEFINGGELFAQVRHDGPLPESRAQHVSSQVLSAIAFLHERGIVHRDIKTENIILVGTGDDIKIVDFGLATPEWDKEMMAMRCGSPGYVAPEVLRGETYGCTVDCFSIGVLLYILLSGRAPFSDRTLNALLQKNLHCKVNPKGLLGVSEFAKDLVMKMLTPWPSVRPAAAQCLVHPWFDTKRPSLEVKPKASECRTGRRLYSKALPYEDVFHSNLRFHTTDSPPNGVPVEEHSTTPATVSDPPVEIHHLSPTVSIEVLGDHMLKNQQATAQPEETPKCSTPPLATPRPEIETGVEMLRSVTPIWAEVQQTLVSLQRQGQEEVSENLFHSENERNDIRISFAHSLRAPSERTSKFFTMGSDSDDEDPWETFNTDLDAAFDTAEGTFIADMTMNSPLECRGDPRSLHGVNRPALPGSVSDASSSTKEAWTRRLGANRPALRGSVSDSSSSSREAWTRRLGAVAEPTSSTDSGRTRRLGGAAFRSPVASMQNTPDPSDIDSPGASPWAWPQRGGTHGTAWPPVAPEQCFGGKSSPTSAASSSMALSEAQLSQLPRLSRGSPKYKPLFAEVERKLARFTPHFMKQRANAQHPRFQQMQFKEYAGYRKAVGDNDDRVSAVYGRDMKSESNDGAFKERLSAFFMRDLLGGKAATTHWDNDSQSESIAGDTLGVLPAEHYSEDLPGMLSLFEPAQPAPALPGDMPNDQRPGAACNPAGAPRRTACSAMGRCRRNSSSTRGQWTEKPSLS
eukprot:CAMPEP_0179212972 /NCGR_PEP_ID=MMETSP0797-20121207/1405_1 /TAXON_ID=47934 /ORGANISM="Dinophysis acuminata, Strain DAEP01" /LENGTH=830 /DNA_ID=CAMNT_0020918649 /DNA_START=36 /DNA_END=2528 /DNA_ORIENTATION=+